MSATARTLPLRVPIARGEALDSWLEALARRSQVTAGTLTAALGWPFPASPCGLVAGVPAGMLRRLEHQTGLPAGRLDDAVLDRWLPLGPVQRRGSRYCPQCLAERDGRWPLAWRLGWVFACTAHGVVLCDTCPACGQAPRSRTGRTAHGPPASCASIIKRHEHCGADLRKPAARRLAPGHPALAAQHWTAALLAAGATAGADGAAARSTLSDLGIAASWLLRQAPAGQLAGFGQQALAVWRERTRPGRLPPASAALTAALAATAMTMLTGSDEQAIEQIRILLPPPTAGPRRPRPAGLPAQRWRQLSQAARGRLLRAMDPDLSPADRIRFRAGTPQAAIPDDPPGLLAARARAIPQLLWPEWAIRLMPARGFAAGPFRSVIAACLLLPGNPARATSTAITALHAHCSTLAVGTVLRALASGGHDAVLTAACCLAGYLDSSGSPIDYQRRRDLIPAETITASEWRELCYGAAAHPGEDRRHRDAQRYLFQLLTGADLHDPRHVLTFTSSNDHGRYQAFADALPTGLRGALHAHAAGLLHSLGIGEPLTWAPPPGCCAGLNLPGPEPGDIDLDAAGRLIITGKLPVTQAAARLGTTAGHVRLALEHIPRPPRQWGRSAAPPTWQRRQHARAVLTREFFEREYTAARKNLRQLEAETGIPRRFISQVAREHGVTMTGTGRPHIQPLAAANVPDAPGPASSSSYRDRMPISLGPDAAAARQAASLFRVLASPTRLAILLTLQTGEQRITSLAAQLGGSQANISAHLIRLRQAGLVTSRTQGRAVYYRLAQPGLSAILDAAAQLPAPTGQQPTEENDKPVRETSRQIDEKPSRTAAHRSFRRHST